MSLETKPASPAKPKGVKTSKKSVAKTDDKPYQYSDKSAGQPHLVPIYNTIKAMMQPCIKDTIKEWGKEGGMYNLVSKKAIEVEGRKRSEVYFASILVQKGYVGFYFMPVYMNSKADEIVKPELMKCLKGKACFYIRKNKPVIMDQIKEALEKGYDVYKQRGWV